MESNIFRGRIETCRDKSSLISDLRDGLGIGSADGLGGGLVGWLVEPYLSPDWDRT